MKVIIEDGSKIIAFEDVPMFAFFKEDKTGELYLKISNTSGVSLNRNEEATFDPMITFGTHVIITGVNIKYA
jgi:hypothetical protein